MGDSGEMRRKVGDMSLFETSEETPHRSLSGSSTGYGGGTEGGTGGEKFIQFFNEFSCLL